MNIINTLEDWNHSRLFNFIIAIFCGSLIGAALYFQYYENMMPCPLCMIQRYLAGAFGVIFLIKALHHLKELRVTTQRIYYFLANVISITGIAFAGRHTYLQSLPADKIPDCGGSIEFIMGALPFFEAIAHIFTGSGSCAEVNWYFLGITMPGWMLIIFIGMTLYSLLSLLLTFKKTS